MFYDYKPIEWNDSVIENNNLESIKEMEKLLNERGYLFASELGGIPRISLDQWTATDYKYTVSEICDDGTVLLDYEPVAKSRFDYLVEDINEKFNKLERRINNA